ncbi:hypothetical protein ACQP0C_41875 (plasmid) [Nocardia sp. CA-129566]|uniref:hypothetical protein n=1 Tax=Nocardia sp. CA-129566 TaxID=3239976 RepID=UPI003D95F18B
MSRRRKRHDALAEHVADSFLDTALQQVVAPNALLEAYLHHRGALETIADEVDYDVNAVRIALHYDIAQLRSTTASDALVAYLYEDESRIRRRCSMCRGVLPSRHSKRGRPRKYCSNACKQRHWRNGEMPRKPNRVRVSGRRGELGVDL